jgi:hypothetical protein
MGEVKDYYSRGFGVELHFNNFLIKSNNVTQ